MVGRKQETEEFSRFLQDQQSRGFLIYGALGVGKSLLAEECSSLAEVKGIRVGRARATQSVSRIPLGSIAHLLPAGVSQMEPARAFTTASQTLSREGGDSEQLIFIDDLHHIDGTSAALLRHLMESQTVKILGTIRTGEAPNSSLLTLSQANDVHRIELRECTLSEAEAVLKVALGGLVGQRTIREFYETSGGNLLYLRELVIGALTSQALTCHDQVWQLTEGTLPKTAKLTELVNARLSDAPAESQYVLDTLALCDTLALSDAESLTSLKVLTDLERTGLIRTIRTGRRISLTLGHPLYAELIGDGIAPARRKEILLNATRRLATRGARRRNDTLKIATWELAATGTTDPGLLIQAAVLSRHAHDYSQVVSLLRSLPAGQQNSQTLLMLGESLFRTGEPDQAEKTLREAHSAANTDAERLKIAFARTMVLLWHGARTSEALAVNEEALRTLTGKDKQHMLRINGGFLQVLDGKPREGLKSLEKLDSDPQNAPDISIWLRGAMMKTAALALTGRTADAISWSKHAYELHRQYNNQALLMHPTGQLVPLVLSLAEAGMLDEARAVGNQAWDLLGKVRDPVSGLWLAYYQGHTEWLAGRVSAARAWFAESVSQARTHHNYLGYRLAMAGLAAATAVMGQNVEAERIEDEAQRYPSIGYCRGQERIGKAWILAGRGQLADAQAVLTTAAEEARASGFVASEILLLTDVARLGDPSSVTSRLLELADLTDSRFAEARAAMAAALAGNNPAALLQSGENLAALGACLLAAETATTAAAVLRSNGEIRRATAASRKAHEWISTCEGARTPLIFHSTDAADLTARETEIARLTAGGATSKDIAAALVLSVRTVDNHLQRIYQKLGITTRRELQEMLRTRTPGDL
ncbi:LuxR C-terminal-related transcriptional regulator [Streptomyces sp. NPDC015127]|uniref:LuxR C-terminal-related transcriptional regulator n=1 Tax=Streptomyces sp. NPDC015127 TaxID=3364939 RepID=UPI003700C066